MKNLLHIVTILFLTILTQVGGIVYLIVMLITRRQIKRRRVKRIGLFIVLYLLVTFLLVPLTAPVFGRERIKNTDLISAHSFFYKLLNRNYVRPELNKALQQISIGLNQKHQGIKLIYLDANFPFFNKFPLLPHLSHNDGKKIDITLVYQLQNGELTNKKPSVSGYGVFEDPEPNEYDQISICKSKGNWQYDFPKYLTLGKINKEISFSEKGTQSLVLETVKQNSIGKILIEPHLKARLNLNYSKVRYHGCHAVRHDDHIHIQLR